MNFFARHLFVISLATLSVSVFAQDSTRRTPAQRPPAVVSPTIKPAIPAKKYPAQPSVWTQLQAAKDSLNREKAKLLEAQTTATEQGKTIQQLQDSLKTQATAQKEVPQKNTKMVNVLGTDFSFSNYNTTILGALLLLILAFVFVVVRSAKYRHEAHYRTNLFQELSDEFQAHKVKSNEKEKKLARELQDERNKIEEMKGR